MTPHGSDRVRPDGDRFILASRIPKVGWNARVEKTLTSPEHPGTAVLWEEHYFEVVGAETLPQGGFQYVLQPWREEHVIRLADRYDAESEQQRIEDHRKRVARERNRIGTNLMSMVTGLLPARVQEALGNELGVIPSRLTLMSVLPCFAYAVVVILFIVRFIVDKTPPPIPAWAMLLGLYHGLEAAIRFNYAWIHGKPLGSLVGLVAYCIYYVLAPNRAKLVSPFAAEKGMGLVTLPPGDDIAVQDAFRMREPFVTFLTATEQRQAAERYGYDYRHLGPLLAGVTFFFSSIGAVTSLYSLHTHASVHALVSLLLAGYIAFEQIRRLIKMRTDPASSILGYLMRPFTRKVLS